jgi:hypothetical protein
MFTAKKVSSTADSQPSPANPIDHSPSAGATDHVPSATNVIGCLLIGLKGEVRGAT